MAVRDGNAVVNAGSGIVHWRLRGAGGRGREHVNRVAQRDGRGVSLAGKRYFPANIVGFTPFERWVSGE
jgi:hypothetical protein